MEQFLFASSIGAFMGVDRPPGPIGDMTLQHPDIIYGVTKVFGELRIEFDRARVVVGDRTVHLTPSELRVLILLTERLGEIVTRKEIMRDLWESSHVGSASAAEAHISTLRRKIEHDRRQPRHIETVRGRGYRFLA